MEVSGAALREGVEAAVAAVDMLASRGRSPLHLPGGQHRRVALATVLACRPEILVLDEPSTNLDPVARRELADVLLGLNDQGLGTSMLMVTHDLPYALQLCPRSVILDDGVVVADAVGSRTEANRELGLAKMERAGATLTSVETALFELLGAAGTDEFKRVQKLILAYAPNPA